MTKANRLDPDQVAAYLRQRPDFLRHYPGLISELELPHDCGAATSLVERQAQLQRQRLQAQGEQLKELLQAARRNDVQFEKTKRLVVALAGAGNLIQLRRALYQGFKDEFGADAVSLMVLAEADQAQAYGGLRCVNAAEAQRHLGGLMDKTIAHCQKPDAVNLHYMFANADDRGGDNLQSVALLPLHLSQQPIGLVAVASQDPRHYHEQLDTLFLNHVAQVTSACLARLAPRAAS